MKYVATCFFLFAFARLDYAQSVKDTSASIQNKVLQRILLKNAQDLMSKDSSYLVSSEVVIRFEVDSNGKSENITWIKCGNHAQMNLITQAIDMLPDLHSTIKLSDKFLKTTYTLKVYFPQMTCVMYCTAGNINSPDFDNTMELSRNLQAYFKENYKTSKLSKSEPIDDYVTVIFTVNKKNKVDEVISVTGRNMDTRAWVIKMVYQNKDWKAMVKNGKPGETRYNLQVKFPMISVFCYGKPL